MGELPSCLYAAIIEATQKECLIGHIARAFTTIPVRERFGERQQRSQEQNSRAKVSAQKTHSRQPRQQKLEAEVAKACQAIRVSIGLPGSVHRWDSEQSKPMHRGSAMKARGKGDSEKLIS